MPDVTPPTLVIVYLMGADVSPRRTVPKSRAILVAGVNSRSAPVQPVPVTTTVAICPLLPLTTRTVVELVPSLAMAVGVSSTPTVQVGAGVPLATGLRQLFDTVWKSPWPACRPRSSKVTLRPAAMAAPWFATVTVAIGASPLTMAMAGVAVSWLVAFPLSVRNLVPALSLPTASVSEREVKPSVPLGWNQTFRVQLSLEAAKARPVHIADGAQVPLVVPVRHVPWLWPVGGASVNSLPSRIVKLSGSVATAPVLPTVNVTGALVAVTAVSGNATGLAGTVSIAPPTEVPTRVAMSVSVGAAAPVPILALTVTVALRVPTSVPAGRSRRNAR